MKMKMLETRNTHTICTEFLFTMWQWLVLSENLISEIVLKPFYHSIP